jgi:two-component system response regulator AtoC
LALLARRSDLPDAILLDLKMPGRDGLATLGDIIADPERRQIPVVIITSYGGSEQTITAMKAGAYDYITKPFEPDEVLRTAARAVEKRRLSREVERLSAHRATVDPEPAGLIGRHASMREVFKLIGKVAASDATVLITGESGTGKELVAEAIHRHSRRAARALVAVNCAAIPEALLESELFGHERGAFTGAVQARAGRLELADGGTLFLDEIGELSLALQAKLLRAVQERTFERLGGQRTVPSDFRLIAATNRDLTQAMADGRFREDLFYRLDVVRIEVPPLRARRSDIPELAEYFLRRYGAERTNTSSGFSDQAMRALLLHDYPGNVRELENLIQRSVVLAQGPLITVEDLSALAGVAREGDGESRLTDLLAMPIERAVRELERMLIRRALIQAGGNKTEAARLLQMRRQQLYAKLSDLGLE